MFHEKAIRIRLDLLPEKHRIAFAASCTEILLPSYQAFSNMYNWGSYDALQHALEAAWASASGRELAKDDLERLIEISEQLGPDSDDFSSYITGIAERAAAALFYSLECCIEAISSQAVLPARLVVEAIDLHSQLVISIPSVDNAQFQKHNWKINPMMESELTKKQNDLAELQSHDFLDTQFLYEMKHSSVLMGHHLADSL